MAHVLDLDALVERRTFLFRGKAYELRNPDEMSPLDGARVNNYGQKCKEAVAAGATDEATATELEMMIDKTLDLVTVELPAEIKAQMTFEQKVRVINAFSSLSAPTPPTNRRARREAEAMAAKGRKTSARRSAGSNGTTAAIPSGG